MPRKRKDDIPDADDGDELPWNEQQWEEFMKRADLRAARFGELLETMRNDPDRDIKLAREMGWDDLADALDAADRTPVPEPPPPPPTKKPRRRKTRSVNPFTSRTVAKRIPELKVLDGVTMRVDALLREIVRAVPETGDDARWSEAISGPMTAEAKLVGGDGTGLPRWRRDDPRSSGCATRRNSTPPSPSACCSSTTLPSARCASGSPGCAKGWGGRDARTGGPYDAAGASTPIHGDGCPVDRDAGAAGMVRTLWIRAACSALGRKRVHSIPMGYRQRHALGPAGASGG